MKKLLTIALVLGWATIASAFTYENNPASMTLGAYTGGNTFANISVVGSAYIKETGAGAARIRLYHDGSTAHIQTGTGTIEIDPTLYIAAGSAGAPSLRLGAAQSGLYPNGATALGFTISGAATASMDASSLAASISGGWRLDIDTAATATIPTISPSNLDGNTGIGSGGANELALITGGLEALHLEEAGNNVLNSTLNEATGDEVALTIEYTTNKATSGDDTGLVINQTNTASPGTSYLINAGVAGNSKFKVNTAGAVTATSIIVGTSFRGASLNAVANNNTLSVQIRNFTNADNAIEMAIGTASQTTGHFNGVAILPNYSSTGDASGTDLLVNRTEESTGSGAQLLADFQVGSASKFSVDNEGSTDIGGAPTFSGWSTITGDYTIDSAIFFIECDATLGNISTTLPPIASVSRGRMVEVKLTSAANGCYIDANGAETIDGVAGKDITTQWNTLSLIAAVAQWFVK